MNDALFNERLGEKMHVICLCYGELRKTVNEAVEETGKAEARANANW